mgnify:CR=1 FL=1
MPGKLLYTECLHKWDLESQMEGSPGYGMEDDMMGDDMDGYGQEGEHFEGENMDGS